LSEGISVFVASKRTLGYQYTEGAKKLGMVQKSLGDVDMQQIRPSDLSKYILGLPETYESVIKYRLLLRFIDFWYSRGAISRFDLPPLAYRCRPTFIPYIFTKREIRKLLISIHPFSAHHRCFDAETFRTYLLLIYATGARSTEVALLRRKDVDLKRRRIVLQSSEVREAREIPIGPSVLGFMRAYVKGRFPSAKSADYLFTYAGERRPLQLQTLTHNFQRLCKVAGVERRDGCERSPRLLDLKITFAVHRISSWIRAAEPQGKMLPALAAYMGQSGMGATEKYLCLTPERIQKSLDLLSKKHAKKHWRDDPNLMSFLASL
jgi:integrase/recombinase XerD